MARLAAHDEDPVNHDSDDDASGGSGLRPALREPALKSIPPPTESIDSAWGDEEEEAAPPVVAAEGPSASPGAASPAHDSEDPKVEVGVLTSPDDLLDSAWDDIDADSMFPPPAAEKPAPASASVSSPETKQSVVAKGPAIPRSPAVPLDLEKSSQSTPPRAKETRQAKPAATVSDRRLSSTPKASKPKQSVPAARASVPPSVRPVSVVPRATVSSSVRPLPSSLTSVGATKAKASIAEERPALKSVPPPKRVAVEEKQPEPVAATGLVVEADDVAVIDAATVAQRPEAAEAAPVAEESVPAAATELGAEEPAEPRQEVVVDAENLPAFVRAVTAAVPQPESNLNREVADPPPSEPAAALADSAADSSPVPLVRLRSVPPPASTSSPPESEAEEEEAPPAADEATDSYLSSVAKPSRSLPLSKWHWAAAAAALVAGGLAFMLVSRPDSTESVEAEVAAQPKLESPAPPAAVKPSPAKKRAEPAAIASADQDDAREAEPAAQPQQVQVTVDPENARVYFDGKRLGEGPVTVSVEPGEQKKLKVMYRGYRPQSIVVDGSETEVSVKLKRRGAKKASSEKTAAAAGSDGPPPTDDEAAAPPAPKRPPPTSLPPPWARRDGDNPY